MVASIRTNSLKLISKPYWQRAGLFPFALITAFSWTMMVCWFVASIWLFQYNIIWSIGIMIAVFAFGSFLSLMTFRLIQDSFYSYMLELTNDEAYLEVIDKQHHKRSKQMVLLKDIKFAEYYPYQDSANIILHTNYADMQIPLWPFVVSGRDVADFLEGRGVEVINVQQSDKDFPSD